MNTIHNGIFKTFFLFAPSRGLAVVSKDAGQWVTSTGHRKMQGHNKVRGLFLAAKAAQEVVMYVRQSVSMLVRQMQSNAYLDTVGLIKS